MFAGLPGGAGAALGPRLLVGAGVLASLTVFGANGSAYAPLVWIGALALPLAGILLALGFARVIPLPILTPAGIAFAALLAAVVAWTGLSVLWSVEPDRSWEYANRGIVYLAFLAVGLVVGALEVSMRWVAAGGTVLSTAVVTWALAGKVIPDLFPDAERVARLRDPLGYWNALAVVAGIAILFTLWTASRREYRPSMRAAAAAALFASAVALLLTYSRGGVLAAGVVVAAFLVLVPERVQVLAALAVAGPPALAISIWAFSTEGIAADGQPYDARLEAGLVFGALLLLGSALIGATSLYLIRREESLVERVRLPSARPAAAATGALLAVALVVLVAGGWTGRAVDEFTNPAPASENVGPARVVSLSSNSRWDWWQEAWQIFEREPMIGSGAGSFSVARRPYRENLIFVVEPHSVPIQFLAELGLVGFFLFAALVASGVAATVEAVRRRAGAERAAAVALALALLAYLLHALVDYDWDFVALTGPVLLLAGLLLPVGARTPNVPLRRLLAAAAALFIVASVGALAAPWLASREVENAYGAIARGDARAAVDTAIDARRLNPLAIEPLFAAAAAEEARGRNQAALELYVKAVELQPKNSQTWYELAKFESAVGLRDAAIRHVAEAQALDPKSQEVVELIRELFLPKS